MTDEAILGYLIFLANRASPSHFLFCKIAREKPLRIMTLMKVESTLMSYIKKGIFSSIKLKACFPWISQGGGLSLAAQLLICEKDNITVCEDKKKFSPAIDDSVGSVALT